MLVQHYPQPRARNSNLSQFLLITRIPTKQLCIKTALAYGQKINLRHFSLWVLSIKLSYYPKPIQWWSMDNTLASWTGSSWFIALHGRFSRKNFSKREIEFLICKICIHEFWAEVSRMGTIKVGLIMNNNCKCMQSVDIVSGP